jgi:hypothetical protein
MNKMTLSLVAASAMAVAGLAQADSIYPHGTSAQLSSSGTGIWGNPSDTTVMGAGPAISSSTTTVTTTPKVEYVYVQPNINWDRSAAMHQMQRNYHLTHRYDSTMRHQAAATFDVPARAGEASTMTGGAPNMTTDNQTMVVGSYTIPYNVVSLDGPYYVFSY